MIATNAITGKLNEVSKAAEALDIALRGTQNCFDMDRCRSDSLDRKTEGNTSIDSRGSIDVSDSPLLSIVLQLLIPVSSYRTQELSSIAKLSTEDGSFHTASECTFTPQSHSSAYETASEGGLMSPWWASSGTDKNSFETCSSSDMDSEVPSMQLLAGVASYDDLEHSFLSTLQSQFVGSDDDVRQQIELDDAERTLVASKEDDGDEASGGQRTDTDESSKTNDDNITFVADRSSWSLVTKHTVKGCL